MAKSGLSASLLVSHPETKELYVNFDPQILTMLRETECMTRLGLEIPATAKNLRAKQGLFKENYNSLNVSWALYYVKSVHFKTPSMLVRLYIMSNLFISHLYNCVITFVYGSDKIANF